MAERRGHAPHAALWRHDLVSTESRLAGPVDVPCLKWHSRKEFRLQPPRSKRGALYIELREPMKWCPWQDSHPHWTASEAVVSELDYKGMKSGNPGWIAAPAAVQLLLRTTLKVRYRAQHAHHQLCASKAHALTLSYRAVSKWSVRLNAMRDSAIRHAKPNCAGCEAANLHQHLPGYEPDALTVKLQTNENGRIPRCCPGRLLVPNQVSSLALSYPMKSGRAPRIDFASADWRFARDVAAYAAWRSHRVAWTCKPLARRLRRAHV